MKIPVISFVGWSGVGKTTFLVKLISVLKERGIRLAILKQDGHEFDVDVEGKDTWRFSRAGADIVTIANGKHGAVMLNRETALDDLFAHITDIDLIITEGYHEREFPKIEVHRSCFDSLRCPDTAQLIALVTDEPLPNDVPQFSLDDPDSVADFVISYTGLDDECCREYRQLCAGEKVRSPEVRLFVDGKEIAMVPFVQDIIREVNLGVLRRLKDTDLSDGGDIRIELKI